MSVLGFFESLARRKWAASPEYPHWCAQPFGLADMALGKLVRHLGFLLVDDLLSDDSTDAPLLRTTNFNSVPSSMLKNSTDCFMKEPVGVVSYSIAIALLAVSISLAAFMLGLLSLFGYGKLNGKSHRFAGFFGLLIGGAMTAMWCTVPTAINQARKAAQQRSLKSNVIAPIAVVACAAYARSGSDRRAIGPAHPIACQISRSQATAR